MRFWWFLLLLLLLYVAGDAELLATNSARIVYEYCAKTMCQSFNPEDLFTYTEEVVCIYPPQLGRRFHMCGISQFGEGEEVG